MKTARSSPQDLMELVGNKTGLNDTSVKTVWAVSDTLFCEVTTHTLRGFGTRKSENLIETLIIFLNEKMNK